ncbi:MAG: hypothetical protein K8T20_11605 [Planctomycetes bacterium]|nr:hypothetical protein [Planctomycetota bacterium]
MHFRIALAAAVFSAAAAVVSAEDCAACADGKVCLSHEAGDDIAIKQAEAKLKTKDMMGKREAVNGLAEAQMKHMNVRSKKITMELVKALMDTDVDVKALAADKLATLGDPATAVQGLAQQAAYYKKLLGNSKPKKANELPAWEANLKLLGSIYESLAAVKDPSAATTFEADLGDNSPFIARAAAEATAPLKGAKGVVKALYEGMKKWLGPSQQPARPEGTVEAFFGMSQAMAKVVDDPPKNLDGKNQAQAMGIGDAWWKTNEAKYK